MDDEAGLEGKTANDDPTAVRQSVRLARQKVLEKSKELRMRRRPVFLDYHGGCDRAAGMAYFKAKFERLNKVKPPKPVSSQLVVCAALLCVCVFDGLASLPVPSSSRARRPARSLALSLSSARCALLHRDRQRDCGEDVQHRQRVLAARGDGGHRRHRAGDALR